MAEIEDTSVGLLGAVADALMPGVVIEDDGALRAALAPVARAAEARRPGSDFAAWSRVDREALVGELLADPDTPAGAALARVLQVAARTHYADPSSWPGLGYRSMRPGTSWPPGPDAAPAAVGIDELADDYDVIVIGAGAGGGVAACVLAEGGRRVLLVERGESLSRADLPRDHLRNARVFTGLERQLDPPLVGNPRFVGPEGIAVAVGNVDAHVTSPAAKAIDPGQMLAVMGTSTCHVMNGNDLAEVPGMCGVVRDGVVPGLYGYEAGQSGVGDIFAWHAEQGVPPAYHDAARERGISLHEHLSELASAQRVGEHGLVALDWHSGNRSVLVDHELSGVIVGLTLATRPEDVYRALLESTAFGTRTIVEAFETAGVPVQELIVAGGLLRNPFLMQMYADVTRRELSLLESEQGPALGAAMHAAVAAGCYADITAASAAMGRVRRAAYAPDPESSRAYDALYEEYSTLHDYFGRGSNEVMHRLRRIRRGS